MTFIYLQSLLYKKEIKKTLFPDSWSDEKLIKTALDVYNTGQDIITGQGNCFKTKLIEGIDVTIPLSFKEIKINQDNIMRVNILTLLPYKPKID